MQMFHGITDERLKEVVQSGIAWGRGLSVGDTFRGSRGEAQHRGLEGLEQDLFSYAGGYGMAGITDILTADSGIITSITRVGG